MGISSFSENVPTGALYTAFTSKASSPFCRIPPHHAGESGFPESAGRACRFRVIVWALETITPPPHTERRPVWHVLALHRRPVRPCAPHLFDMGGELVRPRRKLAVHHRAAVFLVSRSGSFRHEERFASSHLLAFACSVRITTQRQIKELALSHDFT